jgi:predicted site-specific integrase-resolvase
MNMAEWARVQHADPHIAHRWFRDDTLPEPVQRVGGHIMVGCLDNAQSQRRGKTAIYVRVSSADRKAYDDRQVEQFASWAPANGHEVDQVTTELGAALNGERRTSSGPLHIQDVITIIDDHRDRSASFGAGYVAAGDPPAPPRASGGTAT